MPRRNKLPNDEPTQNALSREEMATGPHARGGAGNNAANQSNEGTEFEAFIGNLSSSDPNSNANALSSSTDTTTPLSLRTSTLPQLPSSQRQSRIAPPYCQVRDKLDISPENKQTRKDLLREAYFPDWKDDAASADLGNPDEMREKDPLGTQIWKLYSKTKTQLPNQERMENLTWRMMAMNLKRKEREQARYVTNPPSTSMS
jgi:GATA-binding protein